VTPYYQDECCQLFLGDARDVLPALDGPYDLVATDPPYDSSSLWAYEVLGSQAARLLALTGALVSYCGVRQLPEATASLSKHLRFRWALSTHNHQSRPMPGMWVLDEWKPVLWYERQHNHQQRYLPTILRGAASKEWHEWGQPLAQAVRLVEFLTSEKGVVLDPFAGGGTFLRAAKDLGRRAVGIEVDECSAEAAANRLSQGVLNYGDRA
jgi:site-specific DNA-methyltransferase (adenine-specific)